MWAVPDRPMYSFHLVSGRLLTPADQSARARVVVVERDHRPRQQHPSRAARRTLHRRWAGAVPVVGIVSDQQENGTVAVRPA